MSDFSLNNILIDGAKAASDVATSWDNTWKNVLGDSGSLGGTTLYGVLCWVGTLFAVGTLIFLIVELYKDLNEGKPAVLTSLVWPLLVAFLLANNGYWLAKSTLSLREIINQANSQVIAITMSGVKLDELYRQANGNIGLQGIISNSMRACQSLSGEAQMQCMSQAVTQAQTFVDNYKSQFGDTSWLDKIQGFLDGIGSAITGGAVDMGVFGLLKPIWMPIVVAVLYWLQIAYQNLLEAALLITALLGPIAVGGSLLPYGPRSIFAWLTGFFSVGFARLCFNIIVGLASVVATSAEGGDPFWFALFAGLLAPILASSLASGAGLTVWTSIASAVGKTATTIGGLMV
ncbi:hypothetical protein [Gloeothece verrucosa]|uniref:TrbL/VirB6 plasmid conjugal transfer protein n=1 Tax=Gloeothece verrucosa (strain PCC 7822) TaxID=497965 RepID=E0UD67_GLOV7|nr:hypothetical protein [Gloeothece verrucosa]ADN12947.1 conserved hypothetical protein [Gloeothece verrucosa PCC 7822]